MDRTVQIAEPKTALERTETTRLVSMLALLFANKGSTNESVSPAANAIVGVTESESTPPAGVCSHSTVELPPNDPTGSESSIGTVGVLPSDASVESVSRTLLRGDPSRGSRNPAASGTCAHAQ